VQDCWHKNYKGAPTDGSPWEKADGGDCGRRVVRGGSWNNKPENLRSANRNRNETDNRNNNLGFRLAQSARAAFGLSPEPACRETGRAWCAGVHEPASWTRRDGSAK